MPSSSGKRRVKLGFATLALAAVVTGTAGCGAGQIPPTDTQLAAVNGDQAQVGALHVNNAALAYPEDGYWATGSDVPLKMAIANNGATADELEQISTTDAASVDVKGDSVIPSQRALYVGMEPPKPAGEEDAGSDAGDVGTATVTLKGLKKNLYPGMVVEMTLMFRESGALKLRVPIEAPEKVRTEEAAESEH